MLQSLLVYWTNFTPSFADALRLNPASVALRRTWLYVLLSSHGCHFLPCATSYAASFPSITRTTFPLISILVFPL